MRYLRMLTNAVLAGILAAVYLAILFLQLNPHLPLANVRTLDEILDQSLARTSFTLVMLMIASWVTVIAALIALFFK